jgi:hypothetical protein
MQHADQRLDPLNSNPSSRAYAVISRNPTAPININISKAFNIYLAPKASGVNKEFNLAELPLLYTRFAIADIVAYPINIVTPL